MATERLTRKQKRVLRQKGSEETPHHAPPTRIPLQLKTFHALTDNQQVAFTDFADGKNLMLHGIAGTGKTFLSFYLSLSEILGGYSQYEKITVIRSVVPTRDMGFLPGSAKDKAKVYEAPYYAICTELFGRGDAYDILKSKNLIEFISTSFVRGITLNDTIVIVDETQNMTFHELDSIITRFGKNCRIVFCGDFRQSDFTREHEKSGLLDFIRILEKMSSFSFIDFQEKDIVRSKLVKEYIINKSKLRLG